MEDTKIEWAHFTHNPWIGCTKISPACDHCYAAEWDKRFARGEHWGAGAPRYLTTVENRWRPVTWARKAARNGERYRVFCCSLADVFDNEVPAEWREELWQVIRDTPELDWLLLTKRIGNVPRMLPADWGDGWPNVWLGITVVTQEEADRDIPKLLDTPAAVRFLSCEPLLGPIDLSCVPWPQSWERPVDDGSEGIDATRYCGREGKRIDWIIAGGESGARARPSHPDWFRSLRDQCQAAGVPFFMKQMSGARKSAMPPIPDDLMIREFPNADA